MRYQNAQPKNVHNTSGPQPSASYPRRAALVGMILSVGAAFALSPGCKSYATCGDTKTCPGDGDADGQGGMGGTGASGSTDEVSCTESEIECDGDCINPETDVIFCGATGSCRGDSAGTTCDSDEICVEGTCELDCAAGLVLCDGTCIDPLTSDDYCGAADGCTAAVACGENLECVQGECFGWSEVGTVDFGDQQIFRIRTRVAENGDATAVIQRRGSSDDRHLFTSTLSSRSMQWVTPTRLDTANTDISDYGFAMNSSGFAVVSWIQAPDDESTPQLWVSVRDDTGIWTTPSVLSSELATASAPAASIDDDGIAYVAWSEHEQPERRVHGSRWQDGAWSMPSSEQLAQGGGPGRVVSSIRLVPLSEGEFFRNVNTHEFGENYRMYTSASSGGLFAGMLDSDEAGILGAWLTDVATDGGGQLAFCGLADQWAPWSSHADAEGGHLLNLLFDADDPAGSRDPSISLGANGLATTIWTEDRVDGSSLNWVSYDLNASPGPTFEDASSWTAPSTNVASYQIAADGWHNQQIVWSAVTDESERRIWRMRRRAFEDDWSEPLLLSEVTPLAAGLSLEFGTSGHGLLTWYRGEAASNTIGYAYFGPQTPAE